MDLFSYLMGKQAGGGGGTGGFDWSLIGYDTTAGNYVNSLIQSDYDYSKQIYDNWDSTQTNLSRKFYKDSNLKYFPNVNINNATDTYYMFGESEIEYIGDFDLTESTNVQYMFYNCKRLKKIGASELNISKANDTRSMFYGCISLESVPAINFKQPSMNYQSMFSGCTNLKNVPVFTSQYTSVWGMSSMFYNCTSLTNNSLNNIMQFLSTVNPSTKTLSSIGFTQAQADICVTLSNWATLSDKGWTTGY